MGDTTTDLDPRVQELLDKEAIREAIFRYCRGVDRGDAELVTSAYHPDAIDDRGHVSYTGETIGEGMVGAMLQQMAMTSHHITGQTIVVHGDTAAVESYMIGIHSPNSPDGPKRMMSSGRSFDKLEKRDGEWRIVERRQVTDMVRMLAMDDEINLGPSAATRDRTDPSYALLED
jgi:ketosteroid isomerase-like protein